MIFGNLYHTVVFFRSQVHVVVLGGVVVFAADDHLVVTVRAGGFPSISHFSDHFSALYFLSDTRPELAQVAVKRLESVPVIDHQAVSISLFPGSKGNDSVAGCIDFRAHFGGKVHA